MSARGEIGTGDPMSERRVEIPETHLTVKEARGEPPVEASEVVFDINALSVYYGSFRAVRDVSLPVYRNQITALIGPSGCGKTTFLRCLNRMNDLIEGRSE